MVAKSYNSCLKGAEIADYLLISHRVLQLNV